MTHRAPLSWLSLAAAGVLLACGASAPTVVATSRSPTPSASSPADVANGAIGLPPIQNTTNAPYIITGRTAADLRAEMIRLGPVFQGRHFDASTNWSVSWQWPRTSDGTCVLSGATVNYTITITGPAWTPPAGVDPSLVAAWRTYMKALAIHEKGHADFVVATVPSVLDALHGATCATANAAAKAVLDQIRQHDIDYDAATNHGATQGAIFPLPASSSGA